MQDLLKSDSTKARNFHGCLHFIDDLICSNDGSEFGKSFKNIYPEELELKCEHQDFNLDIKISDGEFKYKLFHKRDGFPFEVVHIPNRSSKIPSYIFYGTIMLEIIRKSKIYIVSG